MSTKKRVLVIDDDNFMRETLTDVLLEKGYEALWASSGKDAVKMVQEQSYDIVLLDLKMAGMNGLETFQSLKKIKPALKVTIITAYYQEEIIKNCLREGVFGVLYKPLDINKVVEHIEIAAQEKIVMLVDDNENFRFELEAILKEKGYYVIGARDSEEAIQKAIQLPPHVLILDVKLPTLNGCDIFIAIKEIVPTIEGILTTGYRDSETKDMIGMCLERGVKTCLYKPFDVSELLNILGELF